MSTRAEDITKWLLELVPIVEKLNMALLQDRVSYEMIRGDVQSLLAQKMKVFEEMGAIKEEIAQSKTQAKRIIETAEEAARGIVSDAKSIRADALKIRQEADEYMKKMDRKMNERVMEAANKLK